MKLRNKKTGEIATLTLSTNGEDMIIMGNDMLAHITKLSELKDYEDYGEAKEYWYIGIDGGVYKKEYGYFNEAQDNIGNRFETEEEAEKAVEKLKAWKRLKDKGFKFRWIDKESGNIKYAFYVDSSDEINRFDYKDLDLLFGGKE